MSSMLYSKVDEDSGCCKFLTILGDPIKKPLLSITCSSNHYQQDDADNISHKRSSFRTVFIGEEGYQSIPYASKISQTCKKIPVKETTSVWHTKHSNGRKMINEYVKESKINRGSYGKVGLYRNVNDGTPYAIKTICKSRLHKLRVTQSETAMTNVLREISIMKTLQHPNVVTLVEVIDDHKSDYLYMVLEYVDGSCIRNISETIGKIDERIARRYFKDMIAGLIYLHSHNVVHGDIKPENLLLTRSGRVKIGDFSFSHAFEDDNDELRRCPGTPAFTAPECCSDIVYHGKAADTWAMGATLYYMVVGCCPFIADSVPETYEKIVKVPLSIPEQLDPDLQDLLQCLLCKDPMQRITLKKAAKHPWVVKDGGPVPIRSLCSCSINSF